MRKWRFRRSSQLGHRYKVCAPMSRVRSSSALFRSVKIHNRLFSIPITYALRRYLTSFIIFALIAIVSTPRAVWAAPIFQTLPSPLTDYAPVMLTLEDKESTIELTRVDFWPTMVIFLGTWTTTTGSACISRNDFGLLIGGVEYKAASRDVVTDNVYPGVEAPGSGFFNLCGANNSRQVAIPFQAILSDEPATLVFNQTTMALPASLLDLRAAVVTPQPTHTPTITPTFTPTPTPTPTFTPASVSVPTPGANEFALPFSNASSSIALSGEVGNMGIRFHLERVDFWDELPDNKHPQNDIFLVLTGYLTPDAETTGRGCIGGEDVSLLVGSQAYNTDNMREAKRFYDADYPGYIISQCVSRNAIEPTFMVFDVPLSQEVVTLTLHNARLDLVDSIADLEAASVSPLSRTPTDFLPTTTPSPTIPSSAMPTHVSTFERVSTLTGTSADDQDSSDTTVIDLPTSTQVSTAIPSLTNSPTVMPSGITVAAIRDANLRGGPGTEYEIVGGVRAGESLVAVARNSDGTWLLVEGDIWIAAFLVTEPTDNLPVATVSVGPQPTATTNVAATPAVTPPSWADDLAVQGYATEMVSYATLVGGAFDNVSTLFFAASESPSLWLDADWRQEVAANFAIIILANNAIREVTPPAILADVHAKILEATEHFDKAIEYYGSGVGNLDVDLLMLGVSELDAANLAVQEATSLVQALLQR